MVNWTGQDWTGLDCQTDNLNISVNENTLSRLIHKTLNENSEFRTKLPIDYETMVE